MIVGLCGVAGSGKDAVADILVKNHGFVKIAFADPLKRICQDVYDFTDLQLWGPSAERNKPDLRYPRPHGPYSGDTCTCCGQDVYLLPEAERRPCYLTTRFALQQLGTEWGRTCYPLTWAEKALRVADELLTCPCVGTRPTMMYTAKEGLIATVEQTSMGEWQRDDAPATKPEGVVISDVRFENEIHPTRAKGGCVVRIVCEDAGLSAAGAHASETEQLSIPKELFYANVDNPHDGLDKLEARVRALALLLKA